MNQYPYESLKWQDFEGLIVYLSQELLGIACKTFSDGRDGGRDSYFAGTAQLYPSSTAPWNGNFILQCKHTSEANASCSDYSFETTEVNKEIKRLKQRIAAGEPIDNYIIFTNRKLTGTKHPDLIKKISQETGIKFVEIVGREQLNQYLTRYPQIADNFGLNKFFEPIRFYPDDIRDVIVVFASDKTISTAVELEDDRLRFVNLQKVEKNKLNNLNEQKFNYILQTSLAYFDSISDFLRDPRNEQFAEMYENTVGDIQAKIILDRERFNDFFDIIEYIYDFVFNKHQDKLQKHRRFLRVFIHFMYFNCDIGIKA